MSDYEQRPSEMAREVSALQERALQVERDGGPPAVVATYVRLQAGLAGYAEWRGRALSESLAWLTPDSNATAKSQQERWSDSFNRRGGEACRMLLDQVSRDDDPIEQTFEVMAMQEAMSYSVIATMPLAGFMGQVREYLRDFARFRKELDDRWKELTGQNERIHGQIAALRVQVLELFTRAVGEARGWAPKIESAVGTALLGWEKEEEPSPDPSLAPVARTAFETVNLLQKSLDDITKSALSLYANEQTIHTMFGNSRQQLKAYLDQVNVKTVDRAWVDACTATRDAANKCPKDGQKQDVRAFAEQAIDGTEDLVEEFNEVFEDFYEHFAGTFTGDVSDSTAATLAEQEFFNQFWKDVESLNLPGEFRTAADQIVRCEDLSLDRLADEQRRRFKAIVHERVSEIEEKIRELDSSFLERFKLQFIDVPRQLAIDRLKRLVGYEE